MPRRPQSTAPNLLPSLVGYRHHATFDLKNDRRIARAVQLLFAGTAGLFAAAPLVFALPLESGWGRGATVAVTAVACLTYMWVHEATHGVLLTFVSGRRSRYSLRLPYLTTGNDAFLGRARFLVVALGPLVLWGIVLLAMVCLVPADARLTAYILCALNLAGSAGDLVEAWWVARLPAQAMVRDDGTQTTAMVP